MSLKKQTEMIRPNTSNSFNYYLKWLNFQHRLVSMCLTWYFMNTYCVLITRTRSAQEISKISTSQGNKHTQYIIFMHTNIFSEEKVLATTNLKWNYCSPENLKFTTESDSLSFDGVMVGVKKKIKFHTLTALNIT